MHLFQDQERASGKSIGDEIDDMMSDI